MHLVWKRAYGQLFSFHETFLKTPLHHIETTQKEFHQNWWCSLWENGWGEMYRLLDLLLGIGKERTFLFWDTNASQNKNLVAFIKCVQGNIVEKSIKQLVLVLYWSLSRCHSLEEKGLAAWFWLKGKPKAGEHAHARARNFPRKRFLARGWGSFTREAGEVLFRPLGDYHIGLLSCVLFSFCIDNKNCNFFVRENQEFARRII